ncbi:MAG: hypothetical protein Q7K57_48565 [Burkholderiaceae bacterium]|nr:hypothetical protein [Burkholderiaceae bacterium]
MHPSTHPTQMSDIKVDLLQGNILSPDDMRPMQGVPPRLKIPVASVHYDVDSGGQNAANCHVGYGAIPFTGGGFLTLRLQVGSTQLIWLANPADPHIHRLMQAWDQEKSMGVMAIGHEGRATLLHSHFALHPQARALMEQSKQDPHYLARFQQTLFGFVSSGLIQMTATSDIASVRTLSSVRVALLATELTGPGDDFAMPVSI